MPKLVSYTYTLTFGKYNGKTIRWIEENDPGYIVWMDENIDNIKVKYPIIKKCEILAAEKSYRQDHYRQEMDDNIWK